MANGPNHRWNTATEDQAIDRVHRFGQTKEVSILIPYKVGAALTPMCSPV